MTTYWPGPGGSKILHFTLPDTDTGLCNYSYIDPLGQPTATAGSDHCFWTCRPFVCTSGRKHERTHFSKQNKFQVKTLFTTGEAVGLAEWIIDDTCLVTFFILWLTFCGSMVPKSLLLIRFMVCLQFWHPIARASSPLSNSVKGFLFRQRPSWLQTATGSQNSSTVTCLNN